MIKWLLRRGARTFGKTYDYDVSYMLDVINTSTGAGARLSAFPLISQYRGPKEATQIWIGAIFASTLEGDCGPCAQLVVDMALGAGAEPTDLKRCFDGDPQQAGDVGLGSDLLWPPSMAMSKSMICRPELKKNMAAALSSQPHLQPRPDVSTRCSNAGWVSVMPVVN